MAISDREKAQDIFNKTNYVFSKKVSFAEAFPEIDKLEINVTEIGTGIMSKKDRSYNEKTISEYINCSNRACYNGGVSLGNIVREMVRNKLADYNGTAICQGYEGSPKGKRNYRPCVNYFEICAKVTYK